MRSEYRDLNLDSIAGQIRGAIADVDRHAADMSASCGRDSTTELAVRALGEARKHLALALEIVHIDHVGDHA